MNVTALLVLLLLLAISLALGLTMEKWQKTSWFRSRFLMIYIACLAVGFVTYFVFVAPSQAEVEGQSQSLTPGEVSETISDQGISVLEDMLSAEEWTVPLDQSLSLEPINTGLKTGQFLIVNENDTLSNQASVKLYRPPSLVVRGKQLPVDFPSVNTTINDGQIQFEEERLEIEYVTLGHSLFLEYYNGHSDRQNDRQNSGISVSNFSVLVVEVPPGVEVENELNITPVDLD
ncbi:hypothetical protein [Alkalibacillus salilacus]|uniref:Uncharacterized protein n=1 Tax=Alkalibacillus salilacus TaxID=284582 RepID=A0ABT9VET0_9BACI|nr:hypothetical protein [Alkalibacillus salilacus]MDQ0159409.1 hypothetical protein [Alkalibacillus salilacus]